MKNPNKQTTDIHGHKRTKTGKSGSRKRLVRQARPPARPDSQESAQTARPDPTAPEPPARAEPAALDTAALEAAALEAAALETAAPIAPDSPPQNATRLNFNQQRALIALLEAPSIAAAARHTGLNERTIRRWLQQNPDFRDELREMRQQFLAHAATRLQSTATHAVQTLLDLLDSKDRIETGRAALVRTALDFAFRSGAYTDLSDRIQNLETEARQQREKGQTPQPRYRSQLDDDNEGPAEAA